MSGIEFLEQAMDLFPRARRALLTAYADTDAAIAAINVVDVDHYLLKPWEPPEEKLYPVVDAMLESYLAAADVEVRETKVIGHRWSAPSFEVRDFLARNAVPYRWFAADEPEGVRLLAAAGVDASRLPVVVTPDGETLVAPTTTEVAAAVGLSTAPTTDFYDLVIVGGGPAGLGAAVYGASEGLRTLLVERQATGGQAGQSSRIENYLGFPDGVSGAQLTDRARRQATKFGAEILTARDVTGLRTNGPARVVGLRRRHRGGGPRGHRRDRRVLPRPRLPGRRGASPAAASTTARPRPRPPTAPTRDVYIVGGANSAGQAAVFFSRVAKSVTLVVRGDRPGAQHVALPDRAARGAGQRDRSGWTPCSTQAHGDDHLESLTLRHVPTGGTDERVDTEPRVRLHRRAAAHRLAGRHPGPRRARLRAHRPGPRRRPAAAARLVGRPRPVAAGGEHPRGVRRRRRPGRLGQAGRLRRR